ncbi:dockerin type I domain-containing protein [Nanoarchaeota archaeon]
MKKHSHDQHYLNNLNKLIVGFLPVMMLIGLIGYDTPLAIHGQAFQIATNPYFIEGDLIDFDVMAYDNQNIAGFRMDIEYDASQLELNDYTLGDFLCQGNDCEFVGDSSSPGIINNLMYEVGGLGKTGGGCLATIQFTSLMSGNAEIVVSNLTMWHLNGSMAPVAGHIEINVRAIPLNIPGDVDNNRVVNIIDLVTEIKYFTGEYSYEDKADLNSDGIIDIRDIVLVSNAIRNGIVGINRCPDINCLIQNSLNCQPAITTHTVTYTLDPFGFIQSTKSVYEIKGMQGNLCVHTETPIENSVILNEELIQNLIDSGATEEEIDDIQDQVNQEAQVIIGIEAVCEFPTSALPGYFASVRDLDDFGTSCSYSSDKGATVCDISGSWGSGTCTIEEITS